MAELVSIPEVAFNFLCHVARSQNHVTDSLRPELIEQQLKKRRSPRLEPSTLAGQQRPGGVGALAHHRVQSANGIG